MALKYLLNRKSLLDFGHPQKPWDIFISAYNNSERVKTIYEKVNAPQKHWVILPEYGYTPEECAQLPDKIVPQLNANEEQVAREITKSVMNRRRRLIAREDLVKQKVCIDITGFMRPQIMYMIRQMHERGLNTFDVIYTEPQQYARKEDTTFSGEEIEIVRQVMGYEGAHTDETTNDILILGVGYDDDPMSRVINEKDSAKLIQLLSLPSLSADMYQESILRLDRTDAPSALDEQTIFAPANDPFVIAYELSSKCRAMEKRGAITNMYLCPLATKPQALGFSLFYLHELQDKAASILFPFVKKYHKETSTGVGKTWLYEVTL
mgnify:CR=1 FL=1